MEKTFIIDGNNIHDIPSFYDEINFVFMSNKDWQLGQSLDALNDMLYGGYGKIDGNEKIQLVWTNFEKSKRDLGLEATKVYYQNRLKSPSTFNTDFVQKKLANLENGIGQTYIEIILEIIRNHPNIQLITE